MSTGKGVTATIESDKKNTEVDFLVFFGYFRCYLELSI